MTTITGLTAEATQALVQGLDDRVSVAEAVLPNKADIVDLSALDTRVDALEAEEAYSDNIVWPMGWGGLPESFVTYTALRLYLFRFRVPKTGNLRNFSLAIGGGGAANVRTGLYDCGEAVNGVRTKLWDSDVIALTSTISWQSIGDPIFPVQAGDEFELGVVFSSGVANFGSKTTVSNGIMTQLPSGLGFTSPGLTASRISEYRTAALPDLVTPLPATIADADVTTSTGRLCFVGRIE